ncbi:MAG: hypothetical protein V4662_17810 [Verrucomicrobiota bacterium]
MEKHDETELDRLLKIDGIKDLTALECADVLGLCKATIERLVDKEVLGSRRFKARGAKREKIHIPRSSVIRLLVRSSSGDATDTLLAEIEAKAPCWLEIAQREHLQRQTAGGSSLGVRSLRSDVKPAPEGALVQSELFA